MSHTTWSTRWYTILHPVPFSSVLGLGQVISSSSARDCLVRVYQELEPGLELNLCWLCIEFPLLCFIYAFHHHAESIFLLHPPPHAMPSMPFLSLCSEVNGSFDKKKWKRRGKDTPFYFQKAKFQTIFLVGFWMVSGKRHFDGTLCCAKLSLWRDFLKHVLGDVSKLLEKCVIFV